MLYTIPDYYGEFHCTADKCEDTCCAGWQIMIDRKSLKKYGMAAGPFKKRLYQSIDWLQGAFRQSVDKRCAFLDGDNLCELYKNMGEKSLCRTCRLYPRHIEEFEGVREITLSLSCPEAARLILNKKEPVHFLTVEKPGEEEYDDFDVFLYSKLNDAREVMLTILQNRKLPIDARIVLVLGIAHDIQGRVQRGELFSCEEVLEKYQTEQAEVFARESVKKRTEEKRFLLAEKRMELLFSLELLKEDWYMQLLEVQQLLYKEGSFQYAEIRNEFVKWQKEDDTDWEILKEQIMVYFISTYLCGAVYDEKIFAKAQMAAVCNFHLEEMRMARWLENEKQLSMEEVVDLTYRYSREVEHSDENLKKMETCADKIIF